MPSTIDGSIRNSRRAVLAALLAWWPMRYASRRQHAYAAAVTRQSLANVASPTGLGAPLTMGMARVVLQPGVSCWAATPHGLRAIVVEAGVLAVAVESPAPPLLSFALTVADVPDQAADERVIPDGASMTFAAHGVSSVRNPGARPVVLLDAVVFPSEPRPIARAFTTNDGVSFQLLASASGAAAPSGPVSVTLERVRLGPLAAMPADLCTGLTLIYLEAGGLDLVARSGPIFAAKAAASAPYAMPGSLQPVASGEARGLTAGGVIFLAASARGDLTNSGARPAELLALAVRPAT